MNQELEDSRNRSGSGHEKRGKFAIGIAVILSCCRSTLPWARTWYVHPAGIGDALTIQVAVDYAQSGDTVLVAPGVYQDVVAVQIDGNPAEVVVNLYKDIKLLAEQDATTTRIDGAGLDVAVYAQDLGPTAELTGFSINTTFERFACVDGGNAALESSSPPYFAVGVRCDSSSLLIADNALYATERQSF